MDVSTARHSSQVQTVPAPLPHILNVIAGPFAQLAAHDVQGVLAILRAAAHPGEPIWLAKDKALDVPFNGDPKKAREAARAGFQGQPFDINVLPSGNRRKRLLVADMDSTIIGCECLDELADMAGIKTKVAAITERAMRGELDFEDALRERVGLIAGLPMHALARVYAERVRLNPGAKALLATMRANGAYTLLVSGGFTYFTSRVATDAGFDENRGNTLMDDGNALTGKVGDPILGREAKVKALVETASRKKLALADTLAVGDGANDLAMVQKAGLGVAYHAKPVVAEAAETTPHGATIAHGDLTALLYLQGYRGEQIISGA
jgi:phosphoserine phosphatase